MDDYNGNNMGYDPNNNGNNTGYESNNNGYDMNSASGQQPYQQQYYDPYGGNQQPQGGKGMAIASMVLGIVAIVGACCCTFVGIICGAIAVILGIISRKQQREGDQMALAGIICGAIGAAIGIITTIINIVNMANGNSPLQDILDQLSSSGMFIK